MDSNKQQQRLKWLWVHQELLIELSIPSTALLEPWQVALHKGSGTLMYNEFCQQNMFYYNDGRGDLVLELVPYARSKIAFKLKAQNHHSTERPVERLLFPTARGVSFGPSQLKARRFDDLSIVSVWEDTQWFVEVNMHQLAIIYQLLLW